LEREEIKMLTHSIAQEIVKETMLRLDRNINIMDDTGTIIASGDPERIDQLHEGALEVIRTGKPLIITRSDEDHWRGALSGINLPIEFQDKVVGVIGITGDQDEVEHIGGLVKMTTEIMIKHSFLASQAEWKQRIKTLIIEELLKADPSWDFIDQRLDLLQISLQPSFHAAIIDIKERSLSDQAVIQKIEGLIPEDLGLAGFLGVNKLFLLLMNHSETKARQRLSSIHQAFQQLGMHLRIGVGIQTDEPRKIAASYHEAELALVVEQKEDLVFYNEIELKALIFQLNNEFKQNFIHRVFPRINRKWSNTLEVFFQSNLNLKEAADKLYIHKNTLIYRLRKIKEETGYDPQHYTESLYLLIAVWMYEEE
jgi:carbohydrate diacid regulator